MMKIGKKGAITTQTISEYILIFVLLVVLFKILASLYPVGVSAGNELNASGAPLGSFFASGGIVWIVIFAGVLVAIVMSVMSRMKHK